MSAEFMGRRRSIYSTLSWIFFGAVGLWLLGSLILEVAGPGAPPVPVSVGVTVLGGLGAVFRAKANRTGSRIEATGQPIPTDREAPAAIGKDEIRGAAE